MSSRLLHLIASLFVTVPLVCLAQRFGPSRGSDKTLLTGPLLLSPASPPQSPMPNQQWTFVKAVGAADAARSAAATKPADSGPWTLLPDTAYSLSGQPSRPEAAASPFVAAPSAGGALQLGHAPTLRFIPDSAEHSPRQKVPVATPLKRSRTSKPASVPDHFDAQVPPVPTHLLPAPNVSAVP